MKILVTGAYGQLGSEINQLANHFDKWEFHFTDTDTLDISDTKAVQSYFSIHKPDFVINCAAYTAVDKAETEEDLALRVNATAPGVLASTAKTHKSGFIHISTDYVFDGRHFMPYTADDRVSPNTVYGKSKLKGELNCQKENSGSVIIRTSWLYSSFGNNFVKTMLRLGKERGEVNVIYDQIGTPTYAGDLASTILRLIEQAQQHKEAIKPGIYHFSNEGAISWYDFAKAIFELAGVNCKVNPISSAEYKQIAPRPHYSVLDKSKIKATFQLEIPYWKDSLEKCIIKLQKN